MAFSLLADGRQSKQLMLLAQKIRLSERRSGFLAEFLQKIDGSSPRRTSGLQTEVQFPVEKRCHSRTASHLTKPQKSVKFRGVNSSG
jgi:hypothetical protein